jgi:beta-N-acetylhexosaminidase
MHMQAGTSSLQNWSIEQLAGQVLAVSSTGSQADEIIPLLDAYHFGSLVLFPENRARGIECNVLTSVQQVAQLTAGLQEHARKSGTGVPLAIAIDREGGLVQRLKNQAEFTQYPSQADVAAYGDLAMTQQISKAIATELAVLGINQNYAPVADVWSNRENTVIGKRAFGITPEAVIPHLKAALKGYAGTGVVPTIKHFPGHGDTADDSHIQLPVLNKSWNELESIELKPFRAVLEQARPTDIQVMTAHIKLPQVDAERCATMSPTILQGYLRQTMGYKGVILSDSLVMQGALLNAGSLEKAVERSMLAGCDQLLVCGPGVTEDMISKAHTALVDAVSAGRISRERLEESVQRIVALKQTIPVYDAATAARAPEKMKELRERHAALVKLITDKVGMK